MVRLPELILEFHDFCALTKTLHDNITAYAFGLVEALNHETTGHSPYGL